MQRAMPASALAAVLVFGAWAGAPAAGHAASIRLARCFENTTCTNHQHRTPWTHALSLAALTSLGLGSSQPVTAAQAGAGAIQLGIVNFVFATPSGPVTHSVKNFSGPPHDGHCHFCEVDTVGEVAIPADAQSAQVYGRFGNVRIPNSSPVEVFLGPFPKAAWEAATAHGPAPAPPACAGYWLRGVPICGPGGVTGR